MSMDMLPLRGFLGCSKCTRTLSGSASKGRKEYYHYYHCASWCGCRFKAKEVNDTFLKELRRFLINPDYAELFKKVVLDRYANESQYVRTDKAEFIKRISSESNRITKARELLLAGDIDGTDYKSIKTEAEGKIAILEAKIEELSNTSYMSLEAVETILDDAIINLTKLDAIFCTSDTNKKREILGSIYPEKFTFENLIGRTAKINETYVRIYQINSELGGKKNGANEDDFHLPRMVGVTGFEPVTLCL
jgi:site-specific DNA recombinase